MTTYPLSQWFKAMEDSGLAPGKLHAAQIDNQILPVAVFPHGWLVVLSATVTIYRRDGDGGARLVSASVQSPDELRSLLQIAAEAAQEQAAEAVSGEVYDIATRRPRPG